MTAATATQESAPTAPPQETAADLAERCAELRTQITSIQSTFLTQAEVQPRVIELERELATLDARLAQLREKEKCARPAEQPTGPTVETLPELLEHVQNLRRMSTQLETAGTNIKQMADALEAQETALQDLAAVEATALLERIKAGHDDLSDTQRRKFQEQRRGIIAGLRGIPVDLEELPALKRTVARQDSELRCRWTHARAEGRRLVREAIEADARHALSAIEDPRATVAELIEHFETARDLAEAHSHFYNSPAGREVLGYEKGEGPTGETVHGLVRWGVAGQLADVLQLKAYHDRLNALAPGLSLEPNASAVSRTLESIRAHFGQLAYGEEERRLECVCHVKPAGSHVLKHFEASPSQFDPMSRVALERRVAEIEAATKALETIRATPF